jgi:hypothetical protein
MSVTLFLAQLTQFNTHGQTESETQLWQRRLFGPNEDPVYSANRDYSAVIVMMPED